MRLGLMFSWSVGLKLDLLPLRVIARSVATRQSTEHRSHRHSGLLRYARNDDVSCSIGNRIQGRANLAQKAAHHRA